jgi:hypothetical protein
MELINYICKNCNNKSVRIFIINSKITCPCCNTTNDVWTNKLSLAYLKHLIKQWCNQQQTR